MADESANLLYGNGVNGATGDYGLPPLSAADLARRLRGEQPPENLNELRAAIEQKRYGLGARADAKDLRQTGWGVIFPDTFDPAKKAALQPLLSQRQADAGDLFQVFAGDQGYRTAAQESKSAFLARHGAGPGMQPPNVMPYYLLLVGSPEDIPYAFQRQLDVNYATGRIDFDTAEEYDRYARSVVAAAAARQQAQALRRRSIHLFGVTNGDDHATDASSRHLVQPVLSYLRANHADWRIDATLGADANKSALRPLLGEQTPGVLFTASHGLEFPAADARQRTQQGALLCADWPGRAVWGRQPIPSDFYFAGGDLADSADLWGMIAFFFACYGGGTPRLNEFARYTGQAERAILAERGFSAYLPQKMLAHPRGGALAVIAHVERAWEYSFQAEYNEAAGAEVPQTTAFNDVLTRLLDGYPVGAALEPLNQRYAEISSDLSTLLEEISYGKIVADTQLASLWVSNNDARNYVVFGDPAVTVAVGAVADADPARPAFQAVAAPPAAPAAPPAAPAPEPAAFGLEAAAPDRLSASVQATAERMIAALQSTLDQLTELEVKTYVSDQPGAFSPASARAGDLRAYSVIRLGGATTVCLPEKPDGSVDSDLWALHLEMVQQATRQRDDTLRAAADALATLLKALRGG